MTARAPRSGLAWRLDASRRWLGFLLSYDLIGKERSSREKRPMITAGRRRHEDDFFSLCDKEVDEGRNENTDQQTMEPNFLFRYTS